MTGEKLLAAGIGAGVKPGSTQGTQEMRVALHYYNNKEDINRLIDVIGK